jgi:D-sedoheptulose 7-phosphate isomerase
MKFKPTIDAANEAIHLMRNLCESESILAEIEEIADLIVNCFDREGKVLICGNGGSGCDDQHSAEAFTGPIQKGSASIAGDCSNGSGAYQLFRMHK